MSEEDRTCFECTKVLQTSPNATVNRLKREYCGNCWMHHCLFRFRKRLFEIGRPGRGTKLADRSSSSNLETILIDWNSGDSAWGLLNLVRDAVRDCCVAENGSTSDTTADSKNLLLPFRFMVLYIHDDLEESSLGRIQQLRIWQQETYRDYGFDMPIVVSSLECGIELAKNTSAHLLYKTYRTQPENSACNESLTCEFPFYPSSWKNLKQLSDSFKSASSVQDFTMQYRKNLIVAIANSVNATKIFVPEDQSALAIKMFATISMGRGAQLAEQMGLATEIGGIKLVRPLMDLTADDLRDFMRCLRFIQSQNSNVPAPEVLPFPQFSLIHVELEVKSKKGKAVKSILSQCEDFISELQSGYQSTVPTLTRIGAKLRPQSLEQGHQQSHDREARKIPSSTSACVFCKQIRHDTDNPQSSRLLLCYACTNLLQDTEDQSCFREFLSHLSSGSS